MAAARTLHLTLPAYLLKRTRVAAALSNQTVPRYVLGHLRRAASSTAAFEVAGEEVAVGEGPTERWEFTISEDLYGRLQVIGAACRPVLSATEVIRAMLMRYVPELPVGVAWTQELPELGEP